MSVADQQVENIRVLVVDDVQTARWTIKRLLEQMGFRKIDEARDGAEALAKLSATPFQLVISDWHMADMDGLQLLKRMKQQAGLASVPFVLVTSTAQKELVLEALKAGVSDYIVKPVSLQTLSDKIQAVLKRAHAGTQPDSDG